MVCVCVLTLGGCKVSASSVVSLQITAQFLGCDQTELNAALVSRMMQTPVGGRRGSSIMYASCLYFLLSVNCLGHNVVTYCKICHTVLLVILMAVLQVNLYWLFFISLL